MVTLVAAAAGLARVVPIVLDPDVPRRAARPFLIGLFALSLEVGALVGWPLGFTEAALRSRERGEARARMALGEAPWQRLLRLWPAALALSALTALGSLAWGGDARAPGRVARALIAEARQACDSARAPRVVDVPLVRATWLCRPGRAPLLIGEGAGSASSIDFAASSLYTADDLTSVIATDVQVLLPTDPAARLRVGEARILNLHPFSAPSSVAPWARAATIVAAALLSSLLAAHAALRKERHRAVAWAIALAGPSATLTVLRACERSAIGDARLITIPLAAVVATLLAETVVELVVAASRRRYAARRA